MIIKRSIKGQILNNLFKGSVVIIYGARQVGKTTLVKDIASGIDNSLYVSCDEPDVLEAFTDKTSSAMKSFIGNPRLLVIDEAQRIKNAGMAIKTLHDAYPDLQIIATGSSSFELSDKVIEPLTGRHISFTLYPLSYTECIESYGKIEAMRRLDHFMIHGMYPAVVTAESDAAGKIRRIANDYLFKDTLRIETIRKPIVIERLARLLAMQSGSEVSFNEIAERLEISRPTVLSYIRLLEQAFIIFRVRPFGRNTRNEITKFEKIYFLDNGTRNAIIDDFSPVDNRMDKGSLFEQFFIVERIKQYERLSRYTKQYFWRTKTGSEVDLVEQEGKALRAFECKWQDGHISTKAWNNNFPDIPVNLVHHDNITDILASTEL